ncbi:MULTISPECIES: MFS transporter [Cupriavidus]|uniref:General substrate transporter:Major facilitator superfamily MFS_1 n=1 Tax=Cupriavidus pinatubonensis (strain JMP 134 / LMG 1197) TaxID=264198 RepID=Q46PC5_CUPPJ|nr:MULTISPECIES: MFS transporter [Cupriavidus]QYY29595.1 MFS transporter [Cupriavidus pinatubonensis]TPQ33491.1 MFS transporter [Cupriavidus pinatubonensis]
MEIAATMEASQDEAKRRRRAITATILGNGFEWFDFMVYGFFAITIGQLFFPTGNELTSLLLSVATFGVGFVVRPVGGILIGMYSDRVGRKAALSLTILLMAGGTALIGIAPTYEQIGIGAPILIIIARLMQGFSAGGEMGSATAFLTEHAPANQKGYYASWIQSSIGFAVVLGAAAGTVLTLWLAPEEVKAWGWRIPFLLGILIGPIGFYIRSNVDETPAFLATTDKVKKPFSEVLSNFPRETFTTFSMVILWTVCIYVLLFYMPTYAVKTLKMPQSMSFIAGVVGGLIITVLSPFVGALSDRMGRKKILALSSGGILLLAYPMFALVVSAPTQTSLIIFQSVFGILIAGYTGPILAAFSEIFPTRVLSTGLSVAYNVAVMTFGGFASLILTWLIATTGSAMAPALYVVAAAAVSFTGVTLGFRDRSKPGL